MRFDEAEGRVNLDKKRVFWGPLFVKNVLAKMPLNTLMSKSSLKSLRNILQQKGPENVIFLPKQTRPSASSKQLFFR